MALVVMFLLAVAMPSPAGVEEIVAPVGGTVGFAAQDLTSGRSLGWHEHEAFPMQSVFKLPIAIEVLRQVDGKKLDLERVVALGPSDARRGPSGTMVVPAKKTVRELLEAMLITSDNVACDKLLSLVGGPRVVDARVRALGIEPITIRFSELDLGAEKGDNTATPSAMVALLAKIARREVGLSPAPAALLEDLLSRVTTGPQRIKGALPAGTPVGHKTGMSDTRDGKTDATNDVGLITLPNGHRVAIAVFVHASPADIATRDRAIARLARAAYDAFNTSAPADARCPASFAKANSACDERVSSGAQACVYPEGKCSCVRSPPCSGVPMPPGEPRWRCRAARTDGCPDDAPAQGSGCAAPGKTCSYGDCGSLAYSCDPQKRTWFISGGTAPPPSMPRGDVHPLPNPPRPLPLPPQPGGKAAAPAPRVAWKMCPARTIFRCTARSQGVAPPRGETVPQVCGCIPRCPASRPVLIAFESDGRWPDGSRKGRFSCATAGIPSASPARPPL